MSGASWKCGCCGFFTVECTTCGADATGQIARLQAIVDTQIKVERGLRELLADALTEGLRLQAIVDDALHRLESLEEVRRDPEICDGQWYWRSCGEPVGAEAAREGGAK